MHTESIALTTILDSDVLSRMVHAQLFKFSHDLRFAIKELEVIKKTLEDACDYHNADIIRTYLSHAETNRDIIQVVMLAQEGDMCEHTKYETIWSN